MSALARIDPVLARHRLRAPAKLDGCAVLRCLRVDPWPPPSKCADAVFDVDDGCSRMVNGVLYSGRRMTATTNDGGRTWRTVVSNR